MFHQTEWHYTKTPDTRTGVVFARTPVTRAVVLGRLGSGALGRDRAKHLGRDEDEQLGSNKGR